MGFLRRIPLKLLSEDMKSPLFRPRGRLALPPAEDTPKSSCKTDLRRISGRGIAGRGIDCCQGIESLRIFLDDQERQGFMGVRFYLYLLQSLHSFLINSSISTWSTFFLFFFFHSSNIHPNISAGASMAYCEKGVLEFLAYS